MNDLQRFEQAAIDAVRESLARSIRPPAPLSVSEWADRFRILPDLGSAEPGHYRTSRTPFMREIQDCLGVLSPVKRVVFIKPSRIGGSEGGMNWFGYCVDNAPGPFMFVQPRELSAKQFVDQKLEPTILSTPELRDRQRSVRGPGGRFSKIFDGMMAVIANARSAASLRALDARFLYCDEVDAYPGDVDGEGDPLDIALKRTASFGDRAKQYIVSTPLYKGTSRVERYFLQGDQCLYLLPCPHCGHMQFLRLANLVWPEGKPKKAEFCCIDCAAVIPEHHKTEMLEAGLWEPQAEGDGETRSFRINSFYSPAGWSPGWGELAEMYTRTKDIPSQFQVFVNQNLGETWEVRGDAPAWRRLYDRREDYPIGRCPPGVLFLTAGVDVQADRIEAAVWGWGLNRQRWLIETFVFGGDPFGSEPWPGLDKMLTRSWPTERGSLPLAGLGVDSGYATNRVIAWARNQDTRVMVLKGNHWQNWTAVLGNPTASDQLVNGRKTGVLQWPIGGALLKQEIYGYFRLEAPEDGEEYPPGYVHLPKVDAEVVQQLVAEDLITKADRRGFPVREWAKNRDRNEQLDLAVYARAVAERLGISRWDDDDWQTFHKQQLSKVVDTIGKAAQSQTSDQPAAPRSRSGGRWLSTPRTRAGRGRYSR